MYRAFKSALMVTLFVSSAWAQNDMTVKVKGMVCAFCAQGVERKLKEHPEVKEVHVSLEKKEVHILFNEGKSLSKELVGKAMKDAGYIADFGDK